MLEPIVNWTLASWSLLHMLEWELQLVKALSLKALPYWLQELNFQRTQPFHQDRFMPVLQLNTSEIFLSTRSILSVSTIWRCSNLHKSTMKTQSFRLESKSTNLMKHSDTCIKTLKRRSLKNFGSSECHQLTMTLSILSTESIMTTLALLISTCLIQILERDTEIRDHSLTSKTSVNTQKFSKSIKKTMPDTTRSKPSLKMKTSEMPKNHLIKDFQLICLPGKRSTTPSCQDSQEPLPNEYEFI